MDNKKLLKIIFSVMAAGFLLTVLCCGLLMYFVGPVESTVPAEVRATSKSVLAFSIPDDFEPRVSSTQSVFGHSFSFFACWDTPGGGKFLVGASMAPDAEIKDGVPSGMYVSVMQVWKQEAGFSQITIKERKEPRKVMIAGEERDVIFTTAIKGNEEYHKVATAFVDRGRIVMIEGQFPDKHFDEEDFVKMLESGK